MEATNAPQCRPDDRGGGGGKRGSRSGSLRIVLAPVPKCAPNVPRKGGGIEKGGGEKRRGSISYAKKGRSQKSVTALAQTHVHTSLMCTMWTLGPKKVSLSLYFRFTPSLWTTLTGCSLWQARLTNPAPPRDRPGPKTFLKTLFFTTHTRVRVTCHASVWSLKFQLHRFEQP